MKPRHSCPCAGCPTFTCLLCGAPGIATRPATFRGHTIVRDAAGTYHATRGDVRIASDADLARLRQSIEELTP